MGISIGPKPIITDNLIFYADAANPESMPRGGSTWTDIIGGVEISLQGDTPWWISKHGGCIDFDGSNDYGTFTHPALGTESFTLEIWVDPSDNYYNYITFMCTTRGSSGYSIGSDAGNDALYYDQGPQGAKGAPATINNAVATRITTVGTDTSELDAEANLLFDTRTLNLSGGGNVLIDESTLAINSGTPTWDITTNSNHNITLTQDSVLSVSNWQAGDTGVLVVKQDSTGGRKLNVNLGGDAVFLGSATPYTASQAANATDLLGFYFDGAKYYVSIGYGDASQTGAQGASGAQGATGAGTQGTQGIQGVKGDDNSTQGAQGIIGPTGPVASIDNDVNTLVAVLGGNGGITGSSNFKNTSTNVEMISHAIVSGSLSVGFSTNATTTKGRIDAKNDVVAFSTSDLKYKENIIEIDNALDKVNKISGVEFDWIPLTDEEKIIHHGNEGHDIGVIAQEIEKVLPEVVTTRDNGSKAVKYDKIVALLIQAIKEQQIEINKLKNGGTD